MKSHYEKLGVAKTATADQLKSAYRKLAKELHPDRNPGDAAAEARFKEVSEAYSVLSDETKRKEYDDQISGRGAGGFGGFNPNDFGGGDPFSRYKPEVDPFYYDQVMRDIEERRRRASGTTTRTGAPKNKDITIKYTVSLEDVFHGKEIPVTFTVGTERKTINVKIPRGLKDGVKIRYAGQGDRTINNIAPGDLFVEIGIMEHSIFTREDQNLYSSVKVDYLTAMVGGEAEIQTIDGAKLRLRIREETPAGKVMRVPGRGMADTKGNRGDLYVELEMVSPSLSEEEKSAIKSILEKRKA